MLFISIESRPPEQLINLIWNVFFKSRSRGISILTHFPWLANTNKSVWYVVLRDSEKVIGGLVIKDISAYCKNNNEFNVCAIGLVCIDPMYRRKGYSKSILEEAIKEAKNRNFDVITLWTKQWDVYTQHGFKLQDDSIFGTVHHLRKSTTNNIDTDLYKNPIASTYPKELGIPPFAIDCITLKKHNSQIILIKDKFGLIVADWSGNKVDVATMLEIIPEAKWRINSYKNDSLLNELNLRGATLELSLSNLQMWLTLKKELSDIYWPEKFRLSVLDRI